MKSAKTRKIVVLNPTQYKDKRYRKHFESGGFKVVEDKPMLNTKDINKYE